MPIYLTAVFNHFRALRAWASDKDAALTLDVKTFDLEVKYRGRYYALRPLFQARTGGQQIHANVLTENAFGFGGWRPYQAITHSHSTDKLLFKSFLRQAGLRTPASIDVPDANAPPAFDYLLKGAVGSFGKQIAGPFHAGHARGPDVSLPAVRSGSVFAEQFIQGVALKVWFWGSQPFFAHAHDFPTIVGDGVCTVEQLVQAKLRHGGIEWAEYPDRGVIVQGLRFQRLALDSVLEADRSAWIDYRYSQRYERSGGVTAQTDNALPTLLQTTGDQIANMGAALAALLEPSFRAPVMITVDGMLDADGHIWWLEMNTNSVLPPEGYAVMFGDLFT